MHFARSTDERLLLTVFHEDRPFAVVIKKFYVTGKVGPNLRLAPLENAFDVKWHWKRYGFEFGETAIIGSETIRTFGYVPYWSIVIPLTMLSAWLLFSEIRTTLPMNSSEPTPVEGQ